MLGGGTLLGGSYQKGNWDSQVDLTLANRIMKRAVELCPSLTGGKGPEHLSIIRHSVGLRPLRAGGPRLEKERINGDYVVHNYGHGGYGSVDLKEFPSLSYNVSSRARCSEVSRHFRITMNSLHT